MAASTYLTPNPVNNTSHLPICPSPTRRESLRALHEPPVSSIKPMPFPSSKRRITDNNENFEFSSTGSNSNKNEPLAITLTRRPSKYRQVAEISKSDSGKKALMTGSTHGKVSSTRSASYQYLMGSSSKPRSPLPFHSRAA